MSHFTGSTTMLRVVKEGLEVTRSETQDFYNQKYSKYEKREMNVQII
jgi:predicted XRE-type DNA-binding protein